MFAARYFGKRYFPGAYWPPSGAAPVVVVVASGGARRRPRPLPVRRRPIGLDDEELMFWL